MSTRSARGFVLDRRPFREHDLRAELLLDDGDRLDVLCPSGQRSKQRYAGGLTPLALHHFNLTANARGTRLDDARIERAWPALLADLTRQTAALAATGFVRETVGPSPGDGTVFLLLGELYEHLATGAPAAPRLVRFVWEVLDHGGHLPALDRCVRCQSPAPEGALVTVDPPAGGVVCRSCGGGPYRLRASDRSAIRAVAHGDFTRWEPTLMSVFVRVIEGASPEGAALLARADEVFRRPGAGG